MGEGIQFLDIVFFAMIAAFLVLRLRNVLGRRTGNERPPTEISTRPRESNDTDDTVVELPDRTKESAAESAPASGPVSGPDAGAAPGLTQIQIADPSFDKKTFLAGARGAFETIIECFARGDRESLRPLLNDEVYRNITSAIDTREQAKVALESTLVGVLSADIITARLEGRVAFVTVKFVSEQVNVSRDSDGRIVEGDPKDVVQVTDIWTFARNTRSQDPNWTLVETRSPN